MLSGTRTESGEFLSQVRRMMYVAGDVVEPLPTTACLVENAVIL